MLISLHFAEVRRNKNFYLKRSFLCAGVRIRKHLGTYRGVLDGVSDLFSGVEDLVEKVGLDTMSNAEKTK